MWKHAVLAFLGLVSQAAWSAPDLTEAEKRWLQAGWPVIRYAQQQQLPLDIVVQPQATAGQAPLAMAFIADRCKLVLSMRGNPAADAALTTVPTELESIVIETMMAHEIGHCWRYVRGAWHTLPAGFVSTDAPLNDEQLARQIRDMRETRREEGFADLVGLAWARQRHPAQYAALHTWLMSLRDEPDLPGSHHDTRAWVRLAADAEVLDRLPGSPFEQALPLWQQGLLSDD